MRSGRDMVTWADVVEAKKLKSVGPSENVEYIERERHATAIHEACHAVMSYRVQKGFGIDIATIEKGQNFLGFVQPIPLEERFTEWRTTYEADVLVSLASLAGERMFFGGDNSSGVSGDLRSATTLALAMEGLWGMGASIGSRAASLSPASAAQVSDGRDRGVLESQLGRRAEDRLERLYREAGRLLEENRREVLAVAHAARDEQDDHRRGHRGDHRGPPGPARRRAALRAGRLPRRRRGVPRRRPGRPPGAVEHRHAAAGPGAGARRREWPGRRGRRRWSATASGTVNGNGHANGGGAVTEPDQPLAPGWGVLHLFCKPTPLRRRRSRRGRREGGRGRRPPGRDGGHARPQGRRRLHGPRSGPARAAPASRRRSRPPGSTSSTPTSRSPRSASTPRACRRSCWTPGSTRSCRPRASRRSASTR